MKARSRNRRILGAGAMLLLLGAMLPASAAELSATKSIFSQGRWYGGLSGGWISTSGEDYLSLGVGAAYNLADGLSAGASYEAWLIGDPTVQKLSPWVGYTFWQMQRVKPYVAAFWRQNWISGYDDYQDIGARAGVYVAQGRSYLGVGVVYEYRLDDSGLLDRDRWYPEVRFAIGL